jgi:hypothetical protein
MERVDCRDYFRKMGVVSHELHELLLPYSGCNPENCARFVGKEAVGLGPYPDYSCLFVWFVVISYPVL